MSKLDPAGSSQPVRALQRANRVRRARSDLKARIADGRLSAAEIIEACPSEVANMPVAQLLASQRGWGEVRTRAFLNRVSLPRDKVVGRLTDRQRQAVTSRLPDTTGSTPRERPRTHPLLDIHERQDAGRTRLTVVGELDLASAPTLRDRLNRSRADSRDVRLDLSKLEFVDSAGLRVLAQAVSDARQEGVRLDVEGDLAPQVRRVAELTHPGCLTQERARRE